MSDPNQDAIERTAEFYEGLDALQEDPGDCVDCGDCRKDGCKECCTCGDSL